MSFSKIKGITTMREYWISFHKIDLADFLESHYLSRDLAEMKYFELPSCIRVLLINKWRSDWSQQNHELEL